MTKEKKMSEFLYNETGYLLEDGTVVSLKSYEKYFERFVKVYAGCKSAEFRKVEWESRLDCFVLEYSKPADECGNCDELEIYDGVCDGLGEGHNDPHQEFIYYKRVELYTFDYN
jgi:hypothetical protein